MKYPVTFFEEEPSAIEIKFPKKKLKIKKRYFFKSEIKIIEIHDKLINIKRNTKLALYGIDKSPFLINIKLTKNARIAINFILPKYAPLILEIFFLKTQSDTYLVIINLKIQVNICENIKK